jgi:hypothetical protein
MLTAGVLVLPGAAPLALVASLVVCSAAIAGFTALRFE